MTTVLRIPISVAAQQGFARVAGWAAVARLLLTNHGRVIAVVNTPERLGEQATQMRRASWELLQTSARLASERLEKVSLEDACSRLEFDIDELQAEVIAEKSR